MEVEVDVVGLAEIRRKLNDLPIRIGRNAGKRALRKGANVIRDAARNNAKRIDDPETRERIWKNISTASASRSRERQAGGVIMRVGVRGGARPLRKGSDTGLPGGNTTHWRFVELGTSEARAEPFMRPALSDNANRALSEITSSLMSEINKELAKLR